MSDSGSEVEGECTPPRPKRRKAISGAAKYGTKYNSEWQSEFPFASMGKNDPVYSFYCKVCQKDVSCRHQGRGDLKRHEKTNFHASKTQAVQGSSKLCFAPVGGALDKQVKRAEVKMAVVLAHHNIPVATMDHLSPLFHDIFPDSKIAKGFSAARTKTTCILNMALRPHFEETLVTHMKENPFALAIDGSNDTGLQKMNPVTVRIIDSNNQQVTSRFLDMCLTSGSGSATAASIFEAMNGALESRSVPWSNCVALSVDNTSVNMGKHNSILTRATQKHPGIYMMGCPCHILHNAAQKANHSFRDVTTFDVDDFLIDLFYYFDKSTKRKAELAEFADFCDITYRKIIHHVSTRWLSLLEAVDRALKQYPGLKSYFLSKDESSPRFKRLKDTFKDSMTEVYLLFFSHVLQNFTHLNLFLQRDEPLIGALHEQLHKYVRGLMSKLIPVRVLKDSSISAIDFQDRDIQFEDERLQVGMITHQRTRSLHNEGDISPAKVTTFYNGVRAFFTTAIDYSQKNLPLNDELLKNATFVNFSQRLQADQLQVEYFVRRYSELLPFVSPHELTKLSEEFVEYQLLDDSSIPQWVWNKAQVEDEHMGGGSCHYRTDVIWGYISTMKEGDGRMKFPRLLKVAQLVLVMPHSNAEEERVFSMVRKNKTPFRPNLSLDKTLSSLLSVKLATTEPCHKYEPAKQVVDKAGKVTWEYNREHSKT